jgi:hypothetical protein
MHSGGARPTRGLLRLVGSSRKAEEFALAVGGQDSHADHSVASLVAVVDRVRQTASEPSPAFRLDLRERLMTAAETELAPAQNIPEQRRAAPSQAPKTSSSPGRTPLRSRFGTLAGGVPGVTRQKKTRSRRTRSSYSVCWMVSRT